MRIFKPDIILDGWGNQPNALVVVCAKWKWIYGESNELEKIVKSDLYQTLAYLAWVRSQPSRQIKSAIGILVYLKKEARINCVYFGPIDINPVCWLVGCQSLRNYTIQQLSSNFIGY